jgi:salicylate hydroxylase
MLPHQGQGGAQGLEDGAALGVLLSHIPAAARVRNPEAGILGASESESSKSSAAGADLDAVIAERLHLFQEIRKNRAAAVQIFSNAGQDEAAKIERDAKPYVNGKVPTNQQEFHDFNFGYSVVEDCLMALKRLHDAKRDDVCPKGNTPIEGVPCSL